MPVVDETMSAQIKILVKYGHPDDNAAKDLLNMCNRRKIKIANLETTRTGFILVVDDIYEAEKLFLSTNQEIFEDAGYSPLIPQEVTCSRTLFIGRVNKFILSHSSNEILHEIKVHNADSNIIDAAVIPNSRSIKISVDCSTSADRLLNHGIKLFNFSLPGSQISKQIHIEIIKCFNCMSYNIHNTKFCPLPRVIKCTNCLGPHSYQNCTMDKKDVKCLHCKGSHHSFAFSCPTRKQLVKDLKKKKSESVSYANATKSSAVYERKYSSQHIPAKQFPPNLNLPPPTLPLPPPFPLHPDLANKLIETVSKTTAVMQIALNYETQEPNTFSKVYEELCRKNNLPILDLGDYKYPTVLTNTVDESDPRSSSSINESDSSFMSANEDDNPPDNQSIALTVAPPPNPSHLPTAPPQTASAPASPLPTASPQAPSPPTAKASPPPPAASAPGPPSPTATSAHIVSNASPKIDYLKAELRLFRIKHSRFYSRAEMKNSFKAGKIAIQCDNMIMKDVDTVDLCIQNRFDVLKNSVETIDAGKMAQLLN